VEGHYKPQTTRSLTFSILRSKIISILCTNNFWLELEGKVQGLGDYCLTRMYVKKSCFQDKH